METELRKTNVPDLIVLVEGQKTIDWFLSHEVRDKFCNRAMDAVEQHGIYPIKFCSNCIHWCSRVTGIMGEKSNF